jgi:hypothetical protein
MNIMRVYEIGGGLWLLWLVVASGCWLLVVGVLPSFTDN